MFKSSRFFRVASAFAVTSLLLLAHKPAWAAIISYNFEATVNAAFINGDAGDTVVGTLSYSDTGNNIISSEDYGTFGTRNKYDADVAISFSVNGKDGSSSENVFNVTNFANNDRYWFEHTPGTFDSSAFDIFLLFNGNENAIDSNSSALPSTLSLAEWWYVRLAVNLLADPSGPPPPPPAPGQLGSTFTADLTSLTRVSAVPVPPAAILFGTALLGLAGLRRRKHKAAD